MWKRGEREPKEDNAGQSGAWLRLAQREIELRKETLESSRDRELYRELEMLARLRAQYPTAPADLVAEFQARLRAGSFTAEAWAEAVEWLEASPRFKREP
jgi:hypothetical protein